jgi:predicted RNase H-like nuclease (RuvC/YqgF family)
MTLERLRAVTALLCLNGVWTEYLKEKGDRARSTKKGLERRIEYLEQKLAEREKTIADLKEKLLSVSQSVL